MERLDFLTSGSLPEVKEPFEEAHALSGGALMSQNDFEKQQAELLTSSENTIRELCHQLVMVRRIQQVFRNGPSEAAMRWERVEKVWTKHKLLNVKEIVIAGQEQGLTGLMFSEVD